MREDGAAALEDRCLHDAFKDNARGTPRAIGGGAADIAQGGESMSALHITSRVLHTTSRVLHTNFTRTSHKLHAASRGRHAASRAHHRFTAPMTLEPPRRSGAPHAAPEAPSRRLQNLPRAHRHLTPREWWRWCARGSSNRRSSSPHELHRASRMLHATSPLLHANFTRTSQQLHAYFTRTSRALHELHAASRPLSRR